MSNWSRLHNLKFDIHRRRKIFTCILLAGNNMVILPFEFTRAYSLQIAILSRVEDFMNKFHQAHLNAWSISFCTILLLCSPMLIFVNKNSNF